MPTEPQVLPAIVWWQSPVMVRLVATVVSLAVAGLGMADAFPGEKINQIVESVFALVALVTSTWAIKGRADSTVQPVTLTKASAVAKNTTE